MLVAKDVDLLVQQWETTEARKFEQHSALYSLTKAGNNVMYGLLKPGSEVLICFVVFFFNFLDFGCLI